MEMVFTCFEALFQYLHGRIVKLACVSLAVQSMLKILILV